MKTTILVTGAAGFAAEHLIPRLRAEGNHVIGLDRKSAPSAFCDEFINVDLNDVEAHKIRNIEIDIVFHLAAARADWGVSDHEFFRDNVDATSALLENLNLDRLSCFIFVSSISVMPQDRADALDETVDVQPINAYGKSKNCAESLILDKLSTFPDVSLTIVRPSVLYGPSDPGNTGIYRAVDNNIFRLIDGIFSGRFAIVGDGKTVKTTAYVLNFIDALLHVAKSEHASKSEIYIYADAPPTEMAELVEIIRHRLGKNGIGPRLPKAPIMQVAGLLDYISRKTNINIPITKARIETFSRPTNFSSAKLKATKFIQRYSTRQAIEETVDWYLELRKSRDDNFFFFKDRGNK